MFIYSYSQFFKRKVNSVSKTWAIIPVWCNSLEWWAKKDRFFLRVSLTRHDVTTVFPFHSAPSFLEKQGVIFLAFSLTQVWGNFGILLKEGNRGILSRLILMLSIYTDRLMPAVAHTVSRLASLSQSRSVSTVTKFVHRNPKIFGKSSVFLPKEKVWWKSSAFFRRKLFCASFICV